MPPVFRTYGRWLRFHSSVIGQSQVRVGIAEAPGHLGSLCDEPGVRALVGKRPRIGGGPHGDSGDRAERRQPPLPLPRVSVPAIDSQTQS